ncbi:hypothetical protein B0I35DRAFT_452815 [Stachybotrys elegans]|uniref:FAD-binding domain-containing protein n=1 Tax=Stachybotrys elegans TaxID=80388 RepID=A0A8K0SR57_9HYPO|nr:hypothetical protein B0I35DRAFT_452815 [Stachybotrys elegans]
MTKFEVAIIGAGPAGCMLARLLHLGGVNATIFEGEASPNFRSQGGTLDLHSDTGIRAVKEAGLFEEFKAQARYDGQYMAIVDKNLEYHFVKKPEDSARFGERPEIDRVKLRELLAHSLPEGTIKWGHRLQKVDGQTLIFEHTTAEGFDLIVGADGAWSKVRQSIAPDLQPVYMGVASHDLAIPDAEKTAPALYKLVNRGSLFACGEGQRLSIQQLGEGRIEVYACFVAEDPRWMDPDKCKYDVHDLEQTRQAMLDKFSDWRPELREAITSAQGRTVPRSVYSLPPGARWTHRDGVTLIGDAAHLMTPYAGEGVNQALDDSLLLSRAILAAIKDGKDMGKSISKFEGVMFERATPVQQLSYDLCNVWYSTPGAPKTVIPKMVSLHVNQKLPWYLRPMGMLGVHAYFFWRHLTG